MARGQLASLVSKSSGAFLVHSNVLSNPIGGATNVEV